MRLLLTLLLAACGGRYESVTRPSGPAAVLQVTVPAGVTSKTLTNVRRVGGVSAVAAGVVEDIGRRGQVHRVEAAFVLDRSLVQPPDPAQQRHELLEPQCGRLRVPDAVPADLVRRLETFQRVGKGRRRRVDCARRLQP